MRGNSCRALARFIRKAKNLGIRRQENALFCRNLACVMYRSIEQVNFFQASAFQGLLVVLASILHSTTQLIQGDPQTGGALQAGHALQGLVFALATFCTFCDASRGVPFSEGVTALRCTAASSQA